MKNSDKTKEQLLNEINELQIKIIELEKIGNNQNAHLVQRKDGAYGNLKK